MAETGVASASGGWTRSDRIFLVSCAAMTVVGYFNGRWEYLFARRNFSGIFGNDPSGLLMLVGGAGLLVPLWWCMKSLMSKRLSLAKKLIAAGLGVLPMVMFVGTFCATGDNEEQFNRGFREWIAAEVNPAPIQAWLATRAPAMGAVLLSPADWPAEISRLHPERVDLWQGRGVVLTWGQVGHAGDRRQVFVARAGVTVAPTQILWIESGTWTDAWIPLQYSGQWNLVKPAVWCWVLAGA